MTHAERELPPYKAQHGLVAVGAFEPARDSGLDVDHLALPGYEQRRRKYRQARRLIDAFAADDVALAGRAKDNQRATFPSGAGGGGRSGTSDPTYLAATRRRIQDPAELAFEAFDIAMRQLRRADMFRRRALAMTHAEGMILDDEDLEALPADEVCPSCARAGVFSPRGDPKDVGKDSPLCRQCRRFERAHGQWPSRELVRIFDEKGRWTKQEVEKALRSAQSQKPGG